MNIWPTQFEAGDVVITTLGETRLIRQLEGRDVSWSVHFLELDFEGEHVFEDIEYSVVEVVA